MRLATTRLVVPDGSGVLAVRSAAWDWVTGNDVTIPVAVVHQDGTSYDLSGAVAAVLAFIAEGSAIATLQLEWTIVDDVGGLAEFYVTRGMVLALPAGNYATGIQFRDDDTAIEDTPLLAGYASLATPIASFDLPVTVPPQQMPLAQGPQGIPQAPRALVYSGSVVAGTFVKTTSTPGKVSQLLTTDNPLYRTGIAVDSGADGATGSVVQASGQQVTMVLDDEADAVCGQFAFYSQVMNGALTAIDNGSGVAGVFQTNGTAGTTADILS